MDEIIARHYLIQNKPLPFLDYALTEVRKSRPEGLEKFSLSGRSDYTKLQKCPFFRDNYLTAFDYFLKTLNRRLKELEEFSLLPTSLRAIESYAKSARPIPGKLYGTPNFEIRLELIQRTLEDYRKLLE